MSRIVPRSTTRSRLSARALCSIVVLGGALLAIPAPSLADAPPPDDPLSDPALIEAVESAASPSTRITVELVTDDTISARRQAIALGAVVTGSVPGEVVQVSIPAAQVEALAGASTVQFARVPLIANRPVTTHAEFGPVVGQNVTAINADDWHAAGSTGAGVRVGIVDFFDLTLWNPAEHGPLPDANHRLCLDSSGSGFCPATGVDGEEHGVAVAEVIKDMAPEAELFLATAGTVTDLRAVIDWFAANGVVIMTRSLGASYDGAGDGTGPLGAAVDYAASKGLTWFNSGGNDAAGSYGRFVEGVDANGYVDFQSGSDVDTTLAVPKNTNSIFNATCLGLDGVRWSDFGKAPNQVTDYRVEILLNGVIHDIIDASQGAGAPPLEGQDYGDCFSNAFQIELRIRRMAVGDSAAPDIVEVGTYSGTIEHSQVAYSAAKPVVDSRNPSLVAVGAVDPANGSTIGFYSSQGPTNDGRVKPDMSAPSCVLSSIYNPALYGPGACFNGTSAASPAAAGMAALLYGRGLALSGVHLAALTKHLVTDLGVPGIDTAFGTGKALLPAPPPTAINSAPAAYTPLATPTRLLDTRAASATPGAPIGPHPQFTILDLPVGLPGASAVAVSIVSVDATSAGYVQALPTLMGQLGASSSLNVATVGQIQPNFAIVPVGVSNSISLYLFAGGNVVVDIMGYFTPTGGSAAAGRFVAVSPQRVLDTRPETAGPVPPEWTPHRPAAGETVRVTGIPAGAAAAVVNVVADQAQIAGYLRTQPTGVTGLTTSNGNYVPGLASGTLSIVPVGADGTISVYTNASTHIVADLMGYITDATAPSGSTGLFVPLTPARAYDSRLTGGIHAGLTTRTLQMTGQSTPPIPTGASAVSMNLTSDAAAGAGFLTVFPADQALPLISNLNYPAVDPRANAGMVRLSPAGALTTFVNQTTHVIVDVNGYFTG
jgi:Subtilase family